MKRLSWILLLVGITAAAGDPGQEVKSHKTSFKIKNAGITVDGSFSDLQADIKFDPKNLDKSVLNASVGVASINTGIKKRDKDLQMRKYFNVEKYPRIKMISKKIQHIEKNKYKGTFDLTIKGVTKQLEIPFTYIGKENEGTFSAEFTVNRRDFGVGSNSLILSDEATVSIEVVVKGGKVKDSITSKR
jgi:polyisoprenoid-binding protein YceI